jgi:hypothetical protein
VTVEFRSLAAIRDGEFDYLVCKCPRWRECGRHIYATFAPRASIIFELYPFPSSSPDGFHPSIPPKIREDFAEATRCFYAKSFRGVVVMVRRLLQDISRDKGIARGENIKAEITELLASGWITKSLFNAAHEMRHFGSFGAHPQDDGLDDVTEDDVAALFAIANQFTEHIYVLPHQTAELAKKRQMAQQGKKKQP